jgi:Xaa-Pro aminopeptidase
VAHAPDPADVAHWLAADRAARPERLARLREQMAREGPDAYFGVRRENSRYLTGFALGDGEEKVAGQSGWFLVTPEEVVLFADSRYTIQASEEAPDVRVEPVYHDLQDRWADLVGGRARRVAAEADVLPHALWQRLAEAAPEVELVPAQGWIEELRAVKEPSEVERIRAAAAVADAALDRILPDLRPGRTEREVAMALEWEMRTAGAEALAFDVAVLSGPRAALPHGSPGDRRLTEGEVLLFDFGAQVAGYRSDMTRTLFVGTPREEDLAIYRLVAEAQQRALDGLEQAVRTGARPTNREVDALARAVIDEAGQGERFGHGLGHGIGLATHEAPSLGRRSPEAPLPAPTVFSVEPGVYLEGQTGVRIEDLVLFDPDAGRLELLTTFPRQVTTIG